MALPENFGSFEHLQKVYRQQFNYQVQDYFKDLGDNWEPEVNTSRGSLRVACTMLDDDTAPVMAMRHSLFYDVLGYGRAGLALYYGSRETQEPPVEGHPKIVFYFSQDAQSVPEEQDYKVDGEYSLRLMQFENTSPNLKSKLTEIATEIKSQFVVNKQGITLTKGNLGVVYKDPKNGFSNGRRILANTEADAIDIYKRMCNVIDVPFDEKRITVSNPKKPSTTGLSDGTQIIMGKTRRKRAYRRIVNVKFRYAYALIPGEPQPVFLVDTTYRYNPLVKI